MRESGGEQEDVHEHPLVIDAKSAFALVPMPWQVAFWSVDIRLTSPLTRLPSGKVEEARGDGGGGGGGGQCLRGRRVTCFWCLYMRRARRTTPSSQKIRPRTTCLSSTAFNSSDYSTAAYSHRRGQAKSQFPVIRSRLLVHDSSRRVIGMAACSI